MADKESNVSPPSPPSTNTNQAPPESKEFTQSKHRAKEACKNFAIKNIVDRAATSIGLSPDVRELLISFTFLVYHGAKDPSVQDQVRSKAVSAYNYASSTAAAVKDKSIQAASYSYEYTKDTASNKVYPAASYIYSWTKNTALSAKDKTSQVVNNSYQYAKDKTSQVVSTSYKHAQERLHGVDPDVLKQLGVPSVPPVLPSWSNFYQRARGPSTASDPAEQKRDDTVK